MPDSESTFAHAQQVLNDVFGHATFRDEQASIVRHVLADQHAMVIMPTGMGKSLCFQIPGLVLTSDRSKRLHSDARPLTLVLSPLIALMKDQVDALVEKGVDATFVNSSLTRAQRLERYQQIDDGHFDLLYVAPERFRKPDFCEIIQRRDVVLLAVDEAHCISEWGHDFRPDYTRIDDIRNQLSWRDQGGERRSPVTLALTATATPDVQQDILRQLGFSSKQMRIFHSGIDRPNLSLDVEEVWDDDDKLDWICKTRRSIDGSGIVYFTLIRNLSQFSDRLWEQRIPHLVYHGDLPRAQRRELQEQFMDEPDHLVLATNAFGMGVDKEDIRFVLHADLPDSLESYYQEIGRAGRDGEPSQCLLLFDQRDLATQMEFIQWRNPDVEYYERVFHFLKHENEQLSAFGLEWLRERLHGKQKHDRRLETALTMMQRWGTIEGSLQPRPGSPLELQVADQLPPELLDRDTIEAKRKRDQMKLLTMVKYVQWEGDRKQYIHQYFGGE